MTNTAYNRDNRGVEAASSSDDSTRPAFDSRIWLITQKATSLVCNAKKKLTPMPLFGLCNEYLSLLLHQKPCKGEKIRSCKQWKSLLSSAELGTMIISNSHAESSESIGVKVGRLANCDPCWGVHKYDWHVVVGVFPLGVVL